MCNSIIYPTRGAPVVPSVLCGESQRVEYMNFTVLAAVRGLLMLPWKRPPWGSGEGGRCSPGSRGHEWARRGPKALPRGPVKHCRLAVTLSRTASLTRRGTLGGLSGTHVSTECARQLRTETPMLIQSP